MQETFYTLDDGIGERIAMLSDFHNSGHVDDIIVSLQRNHPTIIAITGDFVLGYGKGDGCLLEKQPHVAELFRQCAGICRTYVSLGNHENHLTKKDLADIRDTGVTLLDDEYVFHDDRIAIGGLTSEYVLYQKIGHYVPDTSWLAGFAAENRYKILLDHHPEHWLLRNPKTAKMDINLVLSGHAHGGQIRVFGRGLYCPAQGFFPIFTKGIHPGQYGNMVISAGMSNTVKWLPRVGNPTEIVYVDI